MYNYNAFPFEFVSNLMFFKSYYYLDEQTDTHTDTLTAINHYGANDLITFKASRPLLRNKIHS